MFRQPPLSQNSFKQLSVFSDDLKMFYFLPPVENCEYTQSDAHSEQKWCIENDTKINIVKSNVRINSTREFDRRISILFITSCVLIVKQLSVL
jgi:hypothetical protein